MKFYKIYSATLLWFFAVHATVIGIEILYKSDGWPAGTGIVTTQGLVSIEALTTDSELLPCNSAPEDKSVVKVVGVLHHTTSAIVEISTEHGCVFVAPCQLVYDSSCNDFIPANKITTASTIYSRIHGEIACLGITVHEGAVDCCSLSLTEPHTFFASELEIFAHNADAARVAAFTAKMLKDFVVIAWATAPETIEIFKNTLQAYSATAERITEFVTKTLNSFITNDKKNVAIVTQPPLIAGIPIDSTMYNHMRQYPQLYSPIVISAEMDIRGDVVCTLWTMHIDKNVPGDKENIQFYSWQAIGREVLKRSHSTVKFFVEAEDKKQLEELRKFVKNLPVTVTAELFKSKLGIADELSRIQKRGCFELVIHGATFGIHAIHRMATKGIAPSLVLQTLKYGKCIGARHPERLIFCDQLLDIAVVIDKKTKKILNAGRYLADLLNLNETTPEQVEQEKRAKEEKERKEREAREREEAQEREKQEEANDDTNRDNTEHDDEMEYNDPTNAKTRENFESQPTPELLKSKRTHENLVRDHRIKRIEFKKNPDAFDDQNLLKNITQEMRKIRIDGRINAIKTQIRSQKCRLSIINSILRRRGQLL